MRKVSLWLGLCRASRAVSLAVFLIFSLAIAITAQQKRTHNDVMRDIAGTRGRFINAVLAGNGTAVVEEGGKLEGFYKELIPIYEQMKLAPAVQVARQGAAAAAEGVAAGRAKNFEAAAATHRALSRSCLNCHPLYRQEAPDGLSYLPQWKPQYRSGQ